MAQPELVYVSLPRNASRSIRLVLFPGDPTSTEAPCFWMVPAREIRDRFRARGWEWSRSFTFSFVRNPWDRLVSAYHFWRPDRELRTRGSHSDWDPRAPLSFGEWVQALVDRGRPEDRRLLLQWPMLCDEDGELLVDFVGRYERLDEDWQRVAARIGPLARLPVTHRTTHRHYSAAYDEATARLVAEACRRDIALFGYELERLGLRAELADRVSFLGRELRRRGIEGTNGVVAERFPRALDVVRELRQRRRRGRSDR